MAMVPCYKFGDMGLVCLLWLQAVASVALAIFRLVATPCGLVTQACVALGGLACGTLLGWYICADRHRLLNCDLIDVQSDLLLFAWFQLHTVELAILALYWLWVSPGDPQTSIWCAFAGIAVGCIAGWEEFRWYLRRLD